MNRDVESLKEEIIQTVKNEILNAFDLKKSEIESKIAELKKAVEQIMNEVIYIKNELKEIVKGEEVSIDYVKRDFRGEESKRGEEVKEEVEDDSDIIICD